MHHEHGYDQRVWLWLPAHSAAALADAISITRADSFLALSPLSVAELPQMTLVTLNGVPVKSPRLTTHPTHRHPIVAALIGRWPSHRWWPAVVAHPAAPSPRRSSSRFFEQLHSGT
jgi:hypothetical protein